MAAPMPGLSEYFRILASRGDHVEVIANNVSIYDQGTHGGYKEYKVLFFDEPRQSLCVASTAFDSLCVAAHCSDNGGLSCAVRAPLR